MRDSPVCAREARGRAEDCAPRACLAASGERMCGHSGRGRGGGEGAAGGLECLETRGLGIGLCAGCGSTRVEGSIGGGI